MLTVTVKVGQVVEIGDIAAIRVSSKTGNEVRLSIVADIIHQIKINPSGLFPKKLASGIVDGRRAYRDAMDSPATMLAV